MGNRKENELDRAIEAIGSDERRPAWIRKTISAAGEHFRKNHAFGDGREISSALARELFIDPLQKALNEIPFHIAKEKARPQDETDLGVELQPKEATDGRS